MTLEYRKRCLEYALQQCREDAIVNMTDDEIIAEWGFQRSPAGPLHAAASRIEKTEAENKRQRELMREALEALQPFAAQTRASGPTEERNIRRARAAAQRLRDAMGGETEK